jgi:hypothetical protein
VAGKVKKATSSITGTVTRSNKKPTECHFHHDDDGAWCNMGAHRSKGMA